MISTATSYVTSGAPVSRVLHSPAPKHQGKKPRKYNSAASASVDVRELRLFQSLDTSNCGRVSVSNLMDSLRSMGLLADDPRLSDFFEGLKLRSLRESLTFEEFSDLIRPNILLIERALQGNLVVPDFLAFCENLRDLFEEVSQNKEGQVADYIPQLARIEADQFAVSVCTIDGQRFSLGDSQVDFSIQSCCKPLNYCLSLEELGEKVVHQFVGREPSGRIFNELALNEQGKPHNPMINAGAIMTSALIKSELDNADRFDFVLDRWQAVSGGHKARFNNAVYQSERASADRNFALGYYMKEKGAFPDDTDLLKTLDFYFQCCSIELHTEEISTVAATLANGGVCPTTGERVLSADNVKCCLSLMCSCGMYDFSGEFAFVVGLPAKSGVGGGIMLTIPNVMGICIWSPRLDPQGNSARGIDFCKRFVDVFNLHNFDNLLVESEKIDPRLNQLQSKAEKVGELIWAASKGDVGAIHRMAVRGHDLDSADYDRRTPLHLAAAEGQTNVVRYLINHGAEINPRDRWGGTPLDDAARQGHERILEILGGNGASHGCNIPLQSLLDVEGCESSAANMPSTDVVELIYAASAGDLLAIRRLVARGIGLNSADYDLRTPLHLAAAEGHSEIVEYFLDQGVAQSPRDRWGNTPLDEAIRHGHDDAAEILGAQRKRLSP